MGPDSRASTEHAAHASSGFPKGARDKKKSTATRAPSSCSRRAFYRESRARLHRVADRIREDFVTFLRRVHVAADLTARGRRLLDQHPGCTRTLAAGRRLKCAKGIRDLRL